MKQAGIKVWVLTGDKVATAINIGKSAGLIDGETEYQTLKDLKIRDENATEDEIKDSVDSGTDFKVEFTKCIKKLIKQCDEKEEALRRKQEYRMKIGLVI